MLQVISINDFYGRYERRFAYGRTGRLAGTRGKGVNVAFLTAVCHLLQRWGIENCEAAALLGDPALVAELADGVGNSFAVDGEQVGKLLVGEGDNTGVVLATL